MKTLGKIFKIYRKKALSAFQQPEIEKKIPSIHQKMDEDINKEI